MLTGSLGYEPGSWSGRYEKGRNAERERGTIEMLVRWVAWAAVENWLYEHFLVSTIN